MGRWSNGRRAGFQLVSRSFHDRPHHSLDPDSTWEAVMRKRVLEYLAVVTLGTLLAAGALAQQEPQKQQPQSVAKVRNDKVKYAATADLGFQPGLEPRAIEILKTACARLAAAKSMSFTAVVSYEGPSLLGPPLIYSTKSEVTLLRPDKLKVITLADGPPSEFYYDGKLMMAFAPTEYLVAIAAG